MKFATRSPSIQTLEKGTGDVYVSIIVPTLRSDPIENEIRVRVAVEKAKDILKRVDPKETANKLIEGLSELYAQANLHEHKDGLGLYVSEKVSLLEVFEFPVEEKIIISDSFEIRDLLVKEQYSIPYYALILNKKITKLYEGKLNILTEVIGEHFPKEFKDDFEYQPPNSASSYSGRALEKAVEKDKSVIEEIRLQRFIGEVDELLIHYLTPETPLFVCGDPKELGFFRKITRNNQNVAGEIRGNYGHLNVDLGDRLWPAMKSYFEKMEEKILDEYKGMPTGRIEKGLENSWRAVMEGRGLKLIVERDLKIPAFLSPDGLSIFREPFEGIHTFLPDAIDDLLEKALKMKNKVFFVHNGKLNDAEGVALIKRF